MKPYAYRRDPLWWISCGLYVLNRFWLKTHFHSAFLHGYFDDVLLIPCALPVLLWLQECLRLRQPGPSPQPGEIVFHLAVWSVLFELIGPHIMKTTGDPLDVLAYVVGGFFAGCWWCALKPGRASFDLLAPYYLWMERVLAGNKLQRCRLTWTGEVRSARRALVLGVGPGRFVAECVRGLPDTHFTCVDASAGMLEQAQRSWQNAGGAGDRIRFVHARLPDWTPEPGAYDLIVTNFFLDCFPPSELARVLTSVARAAQPGAHWLLSDFRVPERGWLKWRARLILACAYTFFRVATKLPAKHITPPDALLRQNGFELVGRRLSEWDLLHADLWRRVGI